MPFFANGEDKNKLSILYLLQCMGTDITHLQLYRAAFDMELMSYFDFQNSLYELEENGWIAAVPHSYGQAYRVSATGEKAMDSMRETLPRSLREGIDRYVREHRTDVQSEIRFPASEEQGPDGTYTVHLSIVEERGTILSLDMVASNHEMAKRMMDNWESSAIVTYNNLMNNLLK